ncbi:hypothetical protein AMAG_16600 [Allomyces macrogynus ATCC 38327]|uniref:Uncharacterized protein n=1 Tax=Allomyces macrogynus (strain ATCC 38327) TaxID=578462 RepID=A0A0L0TC31_ALLM3|nr:hypothetical protein AMAG_16600 [Allomyces macrogynus ATCC 38327]|eukprot:KNE72104.1 hypothetical protein AMAG_16600 [Allomyces macrogynus ATCC 38327]
MLAGNPLLAIVLVTLVAVLAHAVTAATVPSDPLVTFYWHDEPYGPTTVQVLGTPDVAAGQCRGLEGRADGFTYMHAWPTFPDGRAAWKVAMYRDWGCAGEPALVMSEWDGRRGGAYRADPDDLSKPFVVKSIKFVQA